MQSLSLREVATLLCPANNQPTAGYPASPATLLPCSALLTTNPLLATLLTLLTSCQPALTLNLPEKENNASAKVMGKYKNQKFLTNTTDKHNCMQYNLNMNKLASPEAHRPLA